MAKELLISLQYVDRPEGQLPLVGMRLTGMDIETLTEDEAAAVVALRASRMYREAVKVVDDNRANVEAEVAAKLEGDGDGNEEAVPADAPAAEEDDTGDNPELQA